MWTDDFFSWLMFPIFPNHVIFMLEATLFQEQNLLQSWQHSCLPHTTARVLSKRPKGKWGEFFPGKLCVSQVSVAGGWPRAAWRGFIRAASGGCGWEGPADVSLSQEALGGDGGCRWRTVWHPGTWGRGASGRRRGGQQMGATLPLLHSVNGSWH